MVREVICLHVGQAGCQIGNELWELLCLEHDIRPDGLLKVPEESLIGKDDTWKSFFSETQNLEGRTRFTGRCVMVDTDPSTIEGIMHGNQGSFYKPENMLSYKQDCRGNFCEGRTQAVEFRIVDSTMDRLKRMAENCDNLQGFLVFHSLAGGTGSGVTCELLANMRDDFESGKKVINYGKRCGRFRNENRSPH